MSEISPVLEIKGLVKCFPGVVALDDVDFHVDPNEILGLVGENGAGKSTLMKVLIGLYKPDSGSYLINGKSVTMEGPLQAVERGIGMVFQEGCLIPNMTVAENLFLCHEAKFKRNGFINTGLLHSEAEKLLGELSVDVNPGAYVRDISPACKQMVEIARLLWLSRDSGIKNPVLILDEPTTVLLDDEIQVLFSVLKSVKQNASIIFISHRLEEILQLSDRIVVFKDGKFSAEFTGDNATIEKIEENMVGHEMAEEHYRESEQKEPADDVILEVREMSMEGYFDPISFFLHRGEILSFVGALGSGKEEVCRCIAGIQKPDKGHILINGREIRLGSTKAAIKDGVGYIPIDRRQEGLALQLDVASNINFLILKKMIKGFLISPVTEKESAEKWISNCQVKTPGIKTHCSKLSGGNQQKVVIAKWLAANVKVLILDHPTRGIDVGTKDEIYHRIRELAEEGMAVILMSDRIEEDIGLCNRMIMMKDGKITKEMNCPPDNKPTPLNVIEYIV